MIGIGPLSPCQGLATELGVGFQAPERGQDVREPPAGVATLRPGVEVCSGAANGESGEPRGAAEQPATSQPAGRARAVRLGRRTPSRAGSAAASRRASRPGSGGGHRVQPRSGRPTHHPTPRGGRRRRSQPRRPRRPRRRTLQFVAPLPVAGRSAGACRQRLGALLRVAGPLWLDLLGLLWGLRLLVHPVRLRDTGWSGHSPIIPVRRSGRSDATVTSAVRTHERRRRSGCRPARSPGSRRTRPGVGRGGDHPSASTG